CQPRSALFESGHCAWSFTGRSSLWIQAIRPKAISVPRFAPTHGNSGSHHVLPTFCVDSARLLLSEFGRPCNELAHGCILSGQWIGNRPQVDRKPPSIGARGRDLGLDCRTATI